MENYLFLLALLGLAWILQLALSVRQMRRFYRRFAELRHQGKAAMGIGGGTYKGRAYAVIVSDSRGRVVAAEVMRGFTVFAHLRPTTAVAGWSLKAVCADPPADLPENTRRALVAAATNLMNPAAKQRAGSRRPTRVELKEA
jgi:glucitol operon activator protein